MATRANSRAQSDGRAAARPARAAAGNVRVRTPVPGPGAAGGLLSGAVNLLAGQIKGFVPPADLDERDSDYIRETLPGLWLLASMYFRADVRGLHHIPKTGPVLLVGNHSGGMTTPDTLVFTLAFSTFFGVERRFYQLAHNMVVASPLLRFLRKYGTVAADPANAEKALEHGAAVLVYPGGDYEVFRPSWESGKVDMGRRKGFIRLALRLGVPLQPIVSIGGQETALFLTRGERLARLTGVDRLMRLKTLPILLGLPFGVMPAVLGHFPLPSKITIQVMEPIDLRKRYGEDPDVDEIYNDLMARMQDVLDTLQSERRLPVIG